MDGFLSVMVQSMSVYLVSMETALLDCVLIFQVFSKLTALRYKISGKISKSIFTSRNENIFKG